MIRAFRGEKAAKSVNTDTHKMQKTVQVSQSRVEVSQKTSSVLVQGRSLLFSVPVFSHISGLVLVVFVVVFLHFEASAVFSSKCCS